MVLSINLPNLPIEVWENVIDIVADWGILYRSEQRRDVASCRLVCRAWGPRCSLYSFDLITIASREDLQLLSASLRKSPLHAGLVQKLKICGGGAAQDWIATVPLDLPKLPALRDIQFVSVDFKQQHPRFSQYYSLLRRQSPELNSELYFTEEELSAAPAQIASLAYAMKMQIRCNTCEVVNSHSSVIHIKSWPHGITSRMSFQTRRTLQLEDLCIFLSDWNFPVRQWDASIQVDFQEVLGALSREARSAWRDISRVALLCSQLQFEIMLPGMLEMKLSSKNGILISLRLELSFHADHFS